MTSPALLAAAAMLQLSGPGAVPAPAIVHIVSIRFYDGRCTYRITDAVLDAEQLEAALERYHRADGIMLLTGPDLRYRCLEKARGAARRAGFGWVRARPRTGREPKLDVWGEPDRPRP